MLNIDFVVVGGGIGGVTCVETLGYLTRGQMKCALISASSLVKAAINVQQYGRTMESMDVVEKESCSITQQFPNIDVIKAKVESLDTDKRIVNLSDGSTVRYERICLCTGGKPKFLSLNPHVVAIRDTESVTEFQKRLKNAERILVIGNGGIATELVYEVSSCEVIWAIKHDTISATFFDAGAAQFFLPHLQDSSDPEKVAVSKRWTYHVADGAACSGVVRGTALGPDWANSTQLHGSSQNPQKVSVEYTVQLEAVMTPAEFLSSGLSEHTAASRSYPVYAKLSNSHTYGADLIINATGVDSRIDLNISGTQLKSSCLGLVVDSELRTSVPNVYAAGDIVDASGWNHSPLWHQMKLWVQAKQMGCYAAKCMFAHQTGDKSLQMDFCFEMFSHVTSFFGFKVVLLGLFNAQNLNKDEYVVLLRCTKGVEYIKAIIKNGCLVGAVLIGETDLEETFENLILNQLDISHLQDNLLDPDIDIDDYFD